MTKEETILLRVTKGTKLLLKLYCKNSKNLNYNKLFYMAIQEYFENHEESEIFILMNKVDREIFNNKSIKEIEFDLMKDEKYQKIMIK